MKRVRANVNRVIALVVVLAALAGAQRAADTVLFNVRLTEDTTTLFGFCRGSEVRRSLSGPVVMENGELLFYSVNGYALYDQGGALIDSHSVFQENSSLSPDSPLRLRLAYPLDQTSVVYYRHTPGAERPIEVFRKRLMKKRMKPVKDEEYQFFSEIADNNLFNLAHNSITDEMAPRGYLLPQLVGFDALEGATRWWSVDKFYTFASPVLGVQGGPGGFLFPGIKATKEDSRHQMVEPVRSFVNDGRRFYLGAYANMGTTEERYHQTLFFVDHAGNVLLTDTILKQVNKDVMLGEDERTFYTAKQTCRIVFQPTADDQGTVYYGSLDFDAREIAVHKRTYFRHVPEETRPDLAHLFDVEKNITWEPLVLRCDAQQSGGKTIPNVTIVDETGEKRTARARELTRDEFLVRIYRRVYRDIDRKLARRKTALPELVELLREAIAREGTAGCPYSISLSGPKGMLADFDYAPGERVLCARVLAVRDAGDVVVRVDLEEYAEILLFTRDGAFVNRFTFNRQPYAERRDIVVASPSSPIIELDRSGGAGKERYLRWTAAKPRSAIAGR